jgi:hypothetical protein
VTNRALTNPFPWAAEYQYAQSVLAEGSHQRQPAAVES